MKKRNIPDFLVIGAQKSATTWLYYCLRKHPQIYLPPEKEIHYFDRSTEYPSPSLLAVSSPFKRYSFKEFLVKLKAVIKKYLKSGNLNKFLWELKFNFGYYNDRWYVSLFKNKKRNQKCGEVTPSYSILKINDIKRVYKLNPNLKIILLLRNPIERSWSAFLMDLLQQGKEYKDINDKRALSFFKSEANTKRGDYLTIINNWTSIFPKEQLYIGFFEDVKNNPKKLLIEIFRHIRVSSKIDWSKVPFNKKIHAMKRAEISEKCYQFLYDMNYEKIQSLYKKLGNPIIKEWIKK